MKIDNEKYPMIVGARYTYNAKDSAVNATFNNMVGILEAVDLETNVVEIRLEGTIFYWRGTYSSFSFYWTLIK